MMRKNFIDNCILARRSVRDFMPDEIPEEHLNLMLEAMRWAPSAGNLQPWRFYVVKDREKRRELARAALGQDFIADAPVAIVVCAVPEESSWRYGKRGSQLYCIQDTACAVMNLMLSATALGYGSVWVGAFDEKEVSRAISAPASERPVAIVPIGKPRHLEPRTKRKSLSEIVRTI